MNVVTCSMEATESIRPLEFPEIALTREFRGSKEYVLDPVRRSFVRLTPEEWVRQHALGFLIDHLGIPPGLVAVEKAFVYNGMPRRADVVVHNRRGKAILVVECKAPEIALTQSVFDQVSRYNTVLKAPYLMVTNGRLYHCVAVDFEKGSWMFVERMPGFEDMVSLHA